jgi:DNA excision repair protein ERCC-5
MVDSTVLSTLPPSMQLDIMLRLREQQMASNRDALLQRKDDPAQFSQFQIQQYLKASQLR